MRFVWCGGEGGRRPLRRVFNSSVGLLGIAIISFTVVVCEKLEPSFVQSASAAVAVPQPFRTFLYL